MQYPGVYSLPTAAPIHDENPVMATSYRQPTGITSSGKGGAEPYNTSISGVMQPICVPQDRKLLDQFRDKMRTLHYALATENAYRHWPTNIGSLNSCASIATVTSGNIRRRWANWKSRRFCRLIRKQYCPQISPMSADERDDFSYLSASQFGSPPEPSNGSTAICVHLCHLRTHERLLSHDSTNPHAGQ